MPTPSTWFSVDPDDQPPAHADRLILWLARRQWRTLLGGVAFGVPWMLTIALIPAAIGRAIDTGIVARDGGALVRWALVILGLGLTSALTTDLRHWFAVRNWLSASYRSGVAADRAVRRAGPALTRQIPAGEVITVFAADFGRMGMVFDVTARFAGAIVSFVVVAVILLRGSVLLGLIMLIGGPVLLASLALVIRPLQRRQTAQRIETGRLTSLGADTVAGLRVLRGIGGEDTFLARYAAQSQRVRAAGVQLSGVQATLDAAQVLLPGIFVLVVTGIGAHLAVAGTITPGQLVAFYGYTAFLTMPLRTATEFVDKLIGTRVASRRVVRLLQTEPDHPDNPDQRTDPAHPHNSAHPGTPSAGQDPTRLSAPSRASVPPGISRSRLVDEMLPRDGSAGGEGGRGGGSDDDDDGGGGRAGIVDPESGVTVAPGRLTALVSARPEDTAEIAARLGRGLPGRHGVTWDGRPLDDLPIGEVRRRIVVSESEPHLFSGPARRELLALDDESDAADAGEVETRLLATLGVADAADVIDALEGGLDGELEERGRTLSGGQRQRFSLARALLRDPEVLVLIEPTSAVDAHTEARIAGRLAAHRHGRTTVLVTASPLLLDRADVVHLVEGGRVVTSGRHHDLLRGSAAYRRVVLRGEED